MKPALIISLFALLCGLSLAFPQAQAAEKKIPATHMWIGNGTTMTMVYINSVQQCEMLTRQAADINSSEAKCYNQDKLVRSVRCQKNPTGGRASCN